MHMPSDVCHPGLHECVQSTEHAREDMHSVGGCSSPATKCLWLCRVWVLLRARRANSVARDTNQRARCTHWCSNSVAYLVQNTASSLGSLRDLSDLMRRSRPLILLWKPRFCGTAIFSSEARGGSPKGYLLKGTKTFGPWL